MQGDLNRLLKNAVRLWDRLSSRSFLVRERGSKGWKACPTYFFHGLFGGPLRLRYALSALSPQSPVMSQINCWMGSDSPLRGCHGQAQRRHVLYCLAATPSAQRKHVSLEHFPRANNFVLPMQLFGHEW